MKPTFQSNAGHRGRLIIPVSEFSFAVWPVQIHHEFRCVPHAPHSRITKDKLPWRGLIQQVSRWLRRSRGESTALS
jgi:hypothetical protein